MKSKFRSEVYLRYALLSGVVIAFILSGLVAYQHRLLNNELKTVENDNLKLRTQLEKVEKDRLDLTELSQYQQSIIDSFQGQISSIDNTVGTLKKLAQTDKELLKKYSKVYFLNENYVPAKLAQIDELYVFKQNGGNLLIQSEVWPHLEGLLKAASSSNINLLVVSAFRSFDTQAALKSEYKITYGAGTANQFSADQGYSEHQLGTSVDFTTLDAGAVFSKFRTDPAYQWLKDNAHNYGFINLSLGIGDLLG